MPIRITNSSQDAATMYVSIWGDYWREIAAFVSNLPNTRWKESDQVWRTPIDNVVAIRDYMSAHFPDDKRYCGEECTELIRSYFARLDKLREIKASADVDLTAIYPHLHLNQFTKTNYQPGEYQKIGATWLAAIGRGVLADAYGVGKTVQAIMAALILKHRGLIDFVVVVGTKAASQVWEREIKKFTTHRPIRVEGSHRHLLYGRNFFSITTYAKTNEPVQKEGETEEQFKIRYENSDYYAIMQLMKSGRCLFIVDEFHKCARRNARRTQACKRLAREAVMRFGISADGGFQNGGEDIFNTYSIIDENILGDWTTFRKNCLVAKWGGGYSMTDRGKQWVAMRTANYMLRRTRDQIGIERKDINSQVIYVQFSDEERKIYDMADEGAFSKNPETGELQSCRLVDITRMRQACLSPFLLDPKYPKLSSKLDKVEDIVEELIAEGNKIIIYCFFDSWFPLVHERLDRFGVLEVTGKVRNAITIEEKFNKDPNYNIVLATDAAAESLSFPAASVTIKCTVPWNPSKDGQVDGRMDRMTQEKNMLSISVVMQDSYEEDMLDIQDGKREDFEAMVVAAGEMGLIQLLNKKREERKNGKRGRTAEERAEARDARADQGQSAQRGEPVAG